MVDFQSKQTTKNGYETDYVLWPGTLLNPKGRNRNQIAQRRAAYDPPVKREAASVTGVVLGSVLRVLTVKNVRNTQL